jgi:hypothetical protein
MFKLRHPTTPDWEEKAAKLLVGRSIVDVRYLMPDEIEGLGWSHAALVLTLDDNSILMCMADDEGNDAGAFLHQGPSLGGALPIETILPRI